MRVSCLASGDGYTPAVAGKKRGADRPPRTVWLKRVGERFGRALSAKKSSRAEVSRKSQHSVTTFDDLVDGQGIHLYRFERLCRAIGVTPDAVLFDLFGEGSLVADVLKESYPVTGSGDAVGNEERDPMLNRPDAVALVGLMRGFSDGELGSLLTEAMKIRQRRVAQPAPKEQVHR